MATWRVFCCVVVTWLGLHAVAAQAAPSLKIAPLGYRIEQIEPVAGVDRAYDVTARVGVSNSGSTALAVTASITSASPAAVVLDGNVAFGTVQTTSQLRPVRSTDTFKIRFVVGHPASLTEALRLAQAVITGLSWRISCSNCQGNRPPIAHAGTDQTGFVGQVLTLDGSASSDPDGDTLQFSWSVLTMPSGATVQLNNPTSPRPTVILPMAGSYVMRLVVNDGQAASASATVTLTTVNSAPVANAGVDQSVSVGTRVMLNGAQSTDVDGDVLTYEWRLIETPDNSGAALLNADPVNPLADFVVDASGRYVAQLIVRDSQSSSTPDTTIISTLNSAPIANAGADRTAGLGQSVALSAQASSDPDGDPLTYRWSITAPPGSAATLSGTSGATTSFTPDVQGAYIVQVIVNDGAVDSDPDTVTISTVNSRPTATAGPNVTAHVGDLVSLDGTSSSDPDGDALSYTWSLLSAPVGSTAGLQAVDQPAARFVPDQAGLYVAQLIVSDGALDSLPSTTQVTIVALDEDEPVIVIESPPHQSMTNVRAATIRGYLNEPARLVIRGSEVPLDEDNRFSFGAQLSEGWNGFDIQAVDLAGNWTYVYWVIVLDTVPPMQPVAGLIFVEPQQGGMLRVRGDDEAADPYSIVRITNARTGQSVTAVADGNGVFEAMIAGLESDDIQVVALDAAQNQSATTVVPGIGAGELRVTVSAPIDGAVVSSASVLIRGELFGPLDAGVSINNQAAVLFEERATRAFSALIPLRPGENIIEVIAKRPSGTSVVQQIRVTRAGAPQFAVVATPNTGLAPLDVTFEISQLELGQVASIEIDLNGDGTVDISNTNDDRYIAGRYESAGMFAATARITTTAGAATTVVVPITVQTPAQIDLQIQRTWTALGSALRSGDVQTALSFFTQAAGEQYREFLQQPGIDLTAVANSLSSITPASASRSLVEYVLVRTVDGVDRAFLVTFMRGRDGVWRVSSL